MRTAGEPLALDLPSPPETTPEAPAPPEAARVPRWRRYWLRLRKVVLGLALALTVLAILVLAVEGALRLVYPDPLVERLFAPSDETIGYTLAASQESRYWRSGRTIVVTTDATGRRVVPGSPGSAPRTLHVLGDSQVFGWDLTDEETLPAQFQKRLGPGWRVVNHGVPGYGPFAYVERLAQVPPGEVALVVQTETNDFADSYSAQAPAFARCGYLVPRNALGTNLPCWALSSYSFAKMTEAIVYSGDSRLPVPLGFNPATRSAAAVLRYRIEGLYGLAQDRTAPTLFAVIPWDGALVPDRLARYRPRLARPLRIEGLPDDSRLIEAFSAHPAPDRLFLANDYHLSPAGASFVADHLAPAVSASTP